MTRIHLIRHGKASPESANYDELHPRGQEQALRLGQHLASGGAHFDAWYCGPLTRQRDTLAQIWSGSGTHARSWPEANELAGLAEAPIETLMRHDLMLRAQNDAVVGELLTRLSAAGNSLERERAIEALVEHMVVLWVRGEIVREGLETFLAFGRRVQRALSTIVLESRGAQNVAVVTSNNVIGWVVAHLDSRAAERETNELTRNEHRGMLRRFWNASITELVFENGMYRVEAINQVPHLPEELLTYI